MRLVRCLLYGFGDYSSFEKVVESQRSVRLLTDLELTNHSTRNHSAHIINKFITCGLEVTSLGFASVSIFRRL